MKYYFLIISLLLFTESSYPQYNYRYIPEANYFVHSSDGTGSITDDVNGIWNYFQTPTTSQITSVQFISNMGWASHTGMGLVMTSNSGVNWTAVSFNDTTFTTVFNSVYFINQFTGWTVGGGYQIRKTTNGGLNWVKQVPPSSMGVLNSVYFFNANTGIAIGRKGSEFNAFTIKTTDGGVVWTEIVVPASISCELFGQYWFNGMTGWICGKNFLRKTTDQGLTYVNYFAGIPPTSNGANALLCINFQNELTGWIGGSNLDKQNIYKTTNGGLNWVFQNNPVAAYSYTQINDILFTDPDWGYAAHGTPSSGTILFTSNGGANWVVEDGTNTWFDCLNSYNDAIVYCGAGSGKVWYSPIPSGISGTETGTPGDFLLYQNYPNPFNPITKIKYEIRKTSDIRLSVYGIAGNEIKTLLNKRQRAGVYEIDFDGSGLSSGVYYYRLTAGDFTDVKKMVLIK